MQIWVRNNEKYDGVSNFPRYSATKAVLGLLHFSLSPNRGDPIGILSLELTTLKVETFRYVLVKTSCFVALQTDRRQTRYHDSDRTL